MSVSGSDLLDNVFGYSLILWFKFEFIKGNTLTNTEFVKHG